MTSIGEMTRVPACDEPAVLVASLFQQYQLPIFAYLYRLVSRRELAEELAQEAFLRAFAARQRLSGVTNPRAWLYRIATNVAFNALKRGRRFTWLPWNRADDLSLRGPDPAAGAGQRDAVERALAALPLTYRAPLLLYSHYGFTVGEVAEALEIGQGAVKMRLLRAREMFREAYDREANDERSQ